MHETAILLHTSNRGKSGIREGKKGAREDKKGARGGKKGKNGGQEGRSTLLFWPSWNTVYSFIYLS